MIIGIICAIAIAAIVVIGLRQENLPAGFYVASFREGCFYVAPDSSKKLLFPPSRAIEHSGNEIYVLSWTGIKVYDPSFLVIKEISIPSEVRHALNFAVNKNWIVFFNNADDLVYLCDSDGTYVRTYGMNHPADDHLQNVVGIFIDEDRLLLSEDGYNNILLYNFSSDEVSTFKHIGIPGWIGALCKDGEKYYVTAGDEIIKFTQDSEPGIVVDNLPWNITGISVRGSKAYITANFDNGLFEVDLTNGKYNRICDIDYPEDLFVIY